MGNFEKDINKQLKNHEVDFNPDHWAEMERLLDQKDKKKAFAWWFYGIAASVFILITGLVLLTKNGDATDLEIHKISFADTLLEQQSEVWSEKKNQEKVIDGEYNQTNSLNGEEFSVTAENNTKFSDTKVTDNKEKQSLKLALNQNKVISKRPSSQNISNIVSSGDNSMLDDKKILESKLIKDFIAAVEQKRIVERFNIKMMNQEKIWHNNHVKAKGKIEEKYPKPVHTMVNDQLINQWDFFAGSGKSGGHIIRVNYDSQWKGIISKLTGDVERYTLSHPIEYSLSYEGTYGKTNQIGLGLYAQRNNYARWKDDELAVIGSYEFGTEKYGKIRLGGKMSYRTKTIETDYLTYNDMIDPLYGYVTNTLEEDVVSESNSISTGLGAYYSNNRLFASINYDHLASLYLTDGAIQNVQEERVLIGYHLPVSSLFTLTPMVSRIKISEIKGYTPMFQVTYKNQFYLGLAYRNLTVPSVNIGLTVARRLRLNASFGKIHSSDEVINSSKGFVQAGMSYRFK